MKRIFITIIISICTSAAIYAQDALNRELTLEKDYNPSIRDANKINELPEIKSPEVPKSQLEFSNYTLPYSVSPYLINFDPTSYFTDLARSNKRGYLHLGVSSLLDVDGDLGYQILNSNTDFLNIYVSNRYTKSDVTYLHSDRENEMKLHDIWGGLDHKHTFDKAIFNFGGQYNYSSYNYYGDISPYPGDESAKQTNNFFNIHTGIQAKEGAELFYLLNMKYTNFNPKYANPLKEKGRKENRIIIDGELRKDFDSTWDLGLKAAFKSYSYSSVSKESPVSWQNFNEYSLVSFNPYLMAEGTNWQAKLGLLPEVRFGGKSKVYIAPDIYFSYAPTDVLQLYLSATGGVQDNSFFDVINENRYINFEHRVKDSHMPVDGALGVKISPIPNLLFDIYGGYAIIKDEHFYTNTPIKLYYYPDVIKALINQALVPEYSDAKRFNIGGHIHYAYKSMFSADIRGNYYKWDLDNNDMDAWNKPTFVMDAGAGYNMDILPISVGVNYHLETGRKALVDTEKIKLKNIHDLSLKGTYTFNDTFSAYLSLHNLLFQEYDMWYGYPAQKFNLMGGINVKF